MNEIRVRGIQAGENILSRHADSSWENLPLMVKDNTTDPKAITLPNGKKYLPAGTVVGDPTALTTATSPPKPAVAIDEASSPPAAIGLLFSDVILDDSTGLGAAAVLTRGYVNIDALPGKTAPSPAIQAELPRITFEKVHQ